MRPFIRIALICSVLALGTLASGCIIVPAGDHHRCGHYHCW